MTNGLLKCKVSSGLFPQESSVTFLSADRERVELFCPNEFIQDNCLQVEVLEIKDARCLVQLPADPLTTSRIVVVDQGSLKILQAA